MKRCKQKLDSDRGRGGGPAPLASGPVRAPLLRFALRSRRRPPCHPFTLPPLLRLLRELLISCFPAERT
eukprot:scaffold1352_cov261-Pinguiococcus_pyrenoidosus.AAC.4